MPSTPTPAAVPGPANDSTTPAGSPSTAPGGLTGILTPVEPARPAFTLTADAGQEASHEQAAEGTSSAAYQDPGQPENTKNPSGNTPRKEQKSVIRAWLLAAAKRWEKGADARNKRLDLKKAKLQARQVRETVTVNRSEGSTGSGKNSFSSAGRSGSGKSLEKASKTPSGGGVKNTSSGGRNGSAGGSGSSGAGAGRSPSSGNTAGAGGGARGTSGTGSPSSPAGRTPKTDRGNGKTHTPTSSGSSGTGSGGGGPRSTGGGQATKSCSMGGTSSGSRKRADGRTETTTTCGHGSGISLTKEPRPKGRTTPGRASDRTDHTKSPSSAGTAGNEKDASATGPATPPAAKKTTGTGPGKDDQTVKDPKQKDSKNSEAVKDGQGSTSLDNKPTDNKTAPAPTPLINTQPSREAGYRDGTRAAKVVAHVEAWRDGYRDGYADTKEAAAREKARLDQAHADRKNARTPKDQPVPQHASSADYQQPIPPKPTYAPGPQPIQVTSIDATDIHLGEGAARPTISRGEVRRLRDFQQRLHAKTDTMTRIGEATRVLEQHAQEQAKQVAQLLEQARSINAGDKLIAALTKLAETATTQAEKAAELHKRAHRATEACKALIANTDTRYGGIYQAVIDSPETSPAELRYYRQMETASA